MYPQPDSLSTRYWQVDWYSPVIDRRSEPLYECGPSPQGPSSHVPGWEVTRGLATPTDRMEREAALDVPQTRKR